MQLSIKYSTAKSIVKIYRNEGRIDIIDPNEVKKLKHNKKAREKKKSKTRWIKKTSPRLNDLSANLPLREASQNKRPIETRPKTRLSTGKLNRMSYYQDGDEIAIISQQDKLQQERDPEAFEKIEKKYTRSQTKNEHAKNTNDLQKKIIPYKLQKTRQSTHSQSKESGEATVTQQKTTTDSSENIQSVSESKTGDCHNAESQYQIETRKINQSQTKDDGLKLMSKEDDERAKEPELIQRMAINYNGLPVMPLLNQILPGRSSLHTSNLPIFQPSIGIQDYMRIYSPLGNMLLDKNVALQRAMELIQFQNSIQNHFNYARAGLIPGLPLPQSLAFNAPAVAKKQ